MPKYRCTGDRVRAKPDTTVISCNYRSEMWEPMEAYLDNAATTRPSRAALDRMREALEQNYGNPSSKHRKGLEAEQYIRTTTEILAKEWKALGKEIILTSGGTESNNLALIGSALANRRTGMHLIATCFEHASVYQPLQFLSSLGFRITYVPVDSMGHVKLQELLSAICPETILVSVMYVNNEVGAVQNISEISKAIKERNPGILLHVDAIQAFGKYKLIPKREGIDLLSVSGHKIHAPKGSGALYVRDTVKIKPIIYGGGQQHDMRSGTENVPAIAGFGAAVFESCRNMAAATETMYRCKEQLIRRAAAMEDVTVNAVPEGNLRSTAPHIVSLSFRGVRSEVLLHALEDYGVYVSSGSACSSNHPALSGTLKAIGVPEELLDSTLRFSFSDETTEEEIDYAADVLEKLLLQLRKTGAKQR